MYDLYDLSFNEQISEAHTISFEFANDLTSFLNMGFIGTPSVINALDLLPVSLEDFIDVEEENEEIWDNLLEEVNEALCLIEENLEIFTENNIDETIEDLGYIWRSFGRAYEQIEDVLDCNFDIQLDPNEKIEWIKELIHHNE